MASKKELQWLDLYLEHGDSQNAVRAIFTDCSEASVKSRASQLKTKLEPEIDQRFSKIIKKDSIKAFRIISNLMTTAKMESVKLKAAQDILSRAGYDSVSKFEDVTQPQNYKDLVSSLKTSLSGLGDDINDIIDDETQQQLNYLINNQAGSEQ